METLKLTVDSRKRISLTKLLPTGKISSVKAFKIVFLLGSFSISRRSESACRVKINSNIAFYLAYFANDPRLIVPFCDNPFLTFPKAALFSKSQTSRAGISTMGSRIILSSSL